MKEYRIRILYRVSARSHVRGCVYGVLFRLQPNYYFMFLWLLFSAAIHRVILRFSLWPFITNTTVAVHLVCAHTHTRGQTKRSLETETYESVACNRQGDIIFVVRLTHISHTIQFIKRMVGDGGGGDVVVVVIVPSRPIWELRKCIFAFISIDVSINNFILWCFSMFASVGRFRARKRH